MSSATTPRRTPGCCRCTEGLGGIAQDGSGWLFLDESHSCVNGCQEVVEDPIEPDVGVVVGALVSAVVANAEVVRDVEEVLLVLRGEYSLEVGPKKLENIGELPHGLTAIPDARSVVTELV